MAELIGNRYATALFQAVQESETTDAASVLQELRGIHESMQEVPAFQQFFDSPVISDGEKKQFITDAFKGKISAEVLHFLLILVDKGREHYFNDIVNTFQQLTQALHNQVKAVAVTAVPMSQEAQTKLAASLSAMSGKQVTLENQVDESLVGGVVVRMGDRVIDGSVRNRLSLLKEDLSEMIV